MKYKIPALLLLPAVMWAQRANRAFVEEIVDEYKNRTSIEYDIEYSIKYFDNDDTTSVAASVKIVRETKDSIFGGYFYYDVKDSQYGTYSKYFDLGYAYYADHPKKEITRFDAKKEQTFVITGATDGEVINVKFMKPQRIIEMIDEPEATVTYRDVVFQGKAYVAVKILFDRDGDVTNQWIEYFIDKKSRLLERIEYHADLKDQNQHNIWRLKNIRFNTTNAAAIESEFKSVTPGYTIQDYKERTAEETAPLANGITAPDIVLKLYPGDKEVTLSHYKGKIVLLDFWYMSCGPCISAVPHLTKLQQKYKNDIVVLGANPYDSEEKQLKKMPAFITRNNLDYAIGFVDNEAVKQFNVLAFPTLYIIAPDGKIYHSDIGYSDNFEADLEKVIRELLEK